MSKVVRLPDILADFFKQYPSVINELISQIKDGALNLNIDVTALQSVTNNQAYDFESIVNTAIAPLLARLETLETNRSEATESSKKSILQIARERVIAA